MSESVAAQPDATQNQPQPASENTEQSNNEEPKIEEQRNLTQNEIADLENAAKKLKDTNNDIEKSFLANYVAFYNKFNESYDQKQQFDSYFEEIKKDFLSISHDDKNIVHEKPSNTNENNPSRTFYKWVNDGEMNITINEFIDEVNDIKEVNEKEFLYMVNLYKHFHSNKNDGYKLIFSCLEKISPKMMEILLKLEDFNGDYLSCVYKNKILKLGMIFRSQLDRMISVCFWNEQIDKLNENEKDMKDNYTYLSTKTIYLILNIIEEKLVIREGTKTLEERLFRCQKEIKNVYLPESLEVIMAECFSYCKQLTNIDIKCVNLKQIGKDAFSGCENMKEIHLPNTLTKIEMNTFKGCKNLEKIDIPNQLIEIQDYAFAECKKLKKIILPTTVAKIGIGCFQKCTNLEVFAIPGIFAFYTNDDIPNIEAELPPEKTFIIEKLCFSECISLKNLIIKKIKELTIESSAFSSCNQLRDVKFDQPESSQDNKIIFKSSVFANCISLTQFNFPPQSDINDCSYLFDGCINLTTVDFPTNVVLICDGMFRNCESLPAIDMNRDTITKIGNSAFQNCSKLVTKSIPNNITIIGDNSFENNNLLEIETFPASTTEIGKNAFSNCNDIVKLTFPKVAEGKCLLIKNGAFKGCSKLKYAAVYGKAEIYEDAFGDCSDLEYVYKANDVNCHSNAFDNENEKLNVLKL